MSNSEDYKSFIKFARYAIEQNKEKVKNAIIAIITKDEDFLNKMYDNATDFVAKKLCEDTNDTYPTDIVDTTIEDCGFKKCLINGINTIINTEDMVKKTDYDNLKKTLEDKLNSSENKVSELTCKLYNAEAYQVKLQNRIKDLQNEKESEKERADTAELNLKKRNEEIDSIIAKEREDAAALSLKKRNEEIDSIILEFDKKYNFLDKEPVKNIVEESKNLKLTAEPNISKKSFVEANPLEIKKFIQFFLLYRKAPGVNNKSKREFTKMEMMEFAQSPNKDLVIDTLVHKNAFTLTDNGTYIVNDLTLQEVFKKVCNS